MDYTDMKFNDTDKQKLIENRDTICKWVMENIVPQLDKDERVIIGYGGKYRSPRSFMSEPVDNYYFGVYGEDHTIYFNGAKQIGHIGVGEKYGRVSRSFAKVTNPYDIYPVIDNWKLIKSQLLSEVEKNKANRKAIFNFVV